MEITRRETIVLNGIFPPDIMRMSICQIEHLQQRNLSREMNEPEAVSVDSVRWKSGLKKQKRPDIVAYFSLSFFCCCCQFKVAPVPSLVRSVRLSVSSSCVYIICREVCVHQECAARTRLQPGAPRNYLNGLRIINKPAEKRRRRNRFVIIWRWQSHDDDDDDQRLIKGLYILSVTHADR